MKPIQDLLIFIAILSGTVACSPQITGTHVGKIYLDPSFSAQEIKTIEDDLELLKTTPKTETSSEFRQILNVPDGSGNSLYDWLEVRIRYLLPESFSVQNKLFVASHNHSYEHPNSFPTLDSGKETEQNNAASEAVLASNWGSSFYLKGKLDRVLISFNLDESNSVLISSPRVGIVHLRNTFFSPTLPSGETLDLIAQKLFRLSILFHEARHSDGNGKSMGFFHNICPTHHRYSGHDACDASGNGPYTISGLVLKQLLQNYKYQISKTSHDLLTHMAEDFLDRNISSRRSVQVHSGPHSDALFWDDTPEGV
jgi:hypothetical protein